MESLQTMSRPTGTVIAELLRRFALALLAATFGGTCAFARGWQHLGTVQRYEDDGHTFAYQKGVFLHVNYSCQVSAGSITVASVTEKNAFQPRWNIADVTILGAVSEPKEVRISDHAIHEWRYDSNSHAVTLTVPDAAKNWSLQLLF